LLRLLPFVHRLLGLLSFVRRLLRLLPFVHRLLRLLAFVCRLLRLLPFVCGLFGLAIHEGDIDVIPGALPFRGGSGRLSLCFVRRIAILP
jgi:hypothetical protein